MNKEKLVELASLTTNSGTLPSDLVAEQEVLAEFSAEVHMSVNWIKPPDNKAEELMREMISERVTDETFQEMVTTSIVEQLRAMSNATIERALEGEQVVDRLLAGLDDGPSSLREMADLVAEHKKEADNA